MLLDSHAVRSRLIAALFSAALGGALGASAQSQTNITVQGDNGTHGAAARDTARAAPSQAPVTKDTTVVTRPDQTAVPDTAREVGAIPPDQTRVLQRRKEAKNFAAAGLGPAGFGDVNERSPAYDLYLGHFWEVNRFAAIKALGEVASDLSRATMADFHLGANLYAAATDFSPYVGGGLGLGYGFIPGDHEFGFNLGASVGALLFRTASAQMNLEGTAEMMLSQNNDRNPQVYAARVGVLF